MSGFRDIIVCTVFVSFTLLFFLMLKMLNIFIISFSLYYVIILYFCCQHFRIYFFLYGSMMVHIAIFFFDLKLTKEHLWKLYNKYFLACIWISVMLLFMRFFYQFKASEKYDEKYKWFLQQIKNSTVISFLKQCNWLLC